MADEKSPPLTGHQRLLQDRRSIAELLEAALPAVTESTVDDDILSSSYEAIAVLQARGTRDVLETARAPCASSEASDRVLGAQILGELGCPDRTFPEECCDLLLDLVKQDRDLRVMIAAVFALGHLGNERCEPELLALKNRPNNNVRHGLAFALCGAEQPESVEVLLELMEDSYELVRDRATTSIGEMVSVDGARIRAALLRRVDDSDEIVRAEALRGSARRRDERVIPLLVMEFQAKRQHESFFCDAAKTFLGLDEMEDIDSTDLIRALQSRQNDCQSCRLA